MNRITVLPDTFPLTARSSKFRQKHTHDFVDLVIVICRLVEENDRRHRLMQREKKKKKKRKQNHFISFL